MTKISCNLRHILKPLQKIFNESIPRYTKSKCDCTYLLKWKSQYCHRVETFWADIFQNILNSLEVKKYKNFS